MLVTPGDDLARGAGPTRGRLSNWAWVAVFILINAAPALPGGAWLSASPEVDEVWSGPEATTICMPSLTRAARFNVPRCASGVMPPAAVIASLTRAPWATCTTPGFLTAPVTCTSNLATSLGDASGGTEDAGALITGATSGTSLGRARSSCTLVNTSATTTSSPIACRWRRVKARAWAVRPPAGRCASLAADS